VELPGAPWYGKKAYFVAIVPEFPGPRRAPAHPVLGGMLSGSGRTTTLKAPWMAIFPGITISVVVFGLNMLGDAMRDLLDPKLRGGTPAGRS